MAEELKDNIPHIDSPKKTGVGVWIIIALLGLILVAAMGWMYSKKSKAYENCQAANDQMKLEMGAMNEALSGYIDGATNDLKNDFQEMLKTYDALIEKDASQTDSLQMQKDSINVLLAKLTDTRNRSYYEINQLKKRNERLREIMNRYLVTIDSLHTLNVNLTSQLDETTRSLSSTTSERDQLKEQNEKNTALLTKGAKLSAFNFVTLAQRYKAVGSGTKDINRAKRAQIISSTFTVGENNIAQTGNKTIYMQIVGPDGQVLYKRPTDVTQVAGSQILYSGKREINYQGQLIDMTIVYNLEGKEIGEGNYTVNIFADGALIGKDSFTLK